MIELKDFITETLQQIHDAATAFDETNNGTKATTNPRVSSGSENTAQLGILKGPSNQVITTVGFDVAITATDAKESSVGGKLSVAAIFNAGADTKDAASTAHASRIKFTLPLKLGDSNEPAARSTIAISR